MCIPKDPITLSMANKSGEPSRGLFPPASVLYPVTHIPSLLNPTLPACHQPGFVLFLLAGIKQKVMWGEESLTQPQQTTAIKQFSVRHETQARQHCLPLAFGSRLV